MVCVALCNACKRLSLRQKSKSADKAGDLISARIQKTMS